jgi:hypothetical protein
MLLGLKRAASTFFIQSNFGGAVEGGVTTNAGEEQVEIRYQALVSASAIENISGNVQTGQGYPTYLSSFANATASITGSIVVNFQQSCTSADTLGLNLWYIRVSTT